MKKEIMNNVSRTISRMGFQIKKSSPEILVAAGVIGTVASAVLACRATTKVSTILKESKENIESIHQCMDNPDMKEKYTADDSKKDLAIVYAQTGVKLAKLYGPAIILGAVSLTSIVASNNILRKRNAALAAAYATIDKSYKEYRSRVVERFGKDIDRELRYNIKAKEIEETVVNEKGKEKTVKKTVNTVMPGDASDYAKYFTNANPYWENSEEYVEMFFRAQQNYANDLLRSNGYITLNQVYDMLGMKTNKAGMVVGWVYNPENAVGDNYVEFDVHPVHLQRENGEGFDLAYIVDFNVDGNIYEMM